MNNTKLTYEDALELKKAGFPQTGTSFDTEDGGSCNFPSGGVYTPNLSELIEECGKDFGSLQKWGSFKKFTKVEDEWAVFRAGSEESYGGKTPIQAVKNLYIALNKHDK